MLNKVKPKSEFSRNVLTLMTGTTIAQVIPFALSPIITRIYSPSDVGLFSLYFGILSLIGVIITGRYEIAIVLPKDDKKAINVLALSISITVFIASLVMLLLLFFKEEILDLFHANRLGSIIYLIPFSLLLLGLYNSLNYWSNRKKKFKDISKSRIIKSFSGGISQILLGYINLYGGMIYGNIIGLTLSTIFLIKKFFINKDYLLIKYIKFSSIKLQALIYKEFPLINSFHVFSDVFRTSLTTILISSFFGDTILGFYALSIRILQTPLGIIGSSFGQVLYQKFSSIKNDYNSIYFIAKNTLLKLFLVALPIFGILFIFIPDIFIFIFGEKWRIAGEYTRILLPYLFMNFLSSPISQIPIIMNKQKVFFYWSLIANIGVPLLIYFGFKLSFDIKQILYMISFFLIIYYLFIIIWILHLVKGNIK